MSLVRFHYGENNINTGPLKELPEICIDHFYGEDLKSSFFFLSHAHTDHMVGLETDDFLRRLNEDGVRLYCHSITPLLVRSFKRYLGGPEGIDKLIKRRKIVPLNANTPMKLKVERATGSFTVMVTLLSAGHCPGSVMFLFEAPNHRILHTGDFRLGLENDLKRMSCLFEDKSRKILKKIDHLYVDTTFCSSSAKYFPNRKIILKEASDHIQEWISTSDNHIVHLSFSAKFAHEYALLELNKTFNQKIHITNERYDIYKEIPGLTEAVTLNRDSQFHLCGNRNCVDDAQSITVRFSSMWYTRGKTEKPQITFAGRNLTICYSMHSSLQEIAEIIDFLQPKIVTPLVLPKNSDVKKIEDDLKQVCTSTFQYEDYRSTRKDFGEDVKTQEVEILDEVEKDATANLEEDDQPDPDLFTLSQEKQSSPSPAKRPKLDWNFRMTPSPTKSSQSSLGSNSQGSQEITEEPFLLPQPSMRKGEFKLNSCDIDLFLDSSDDER